MMKMRNRHKLKKKWTTKKMKNHNSQMKKMRMKVT